MSDFLLQALNDWLKSSNFRIASAGIECVALVLEVAPDASSPYINELVPTIRDKCLSDSKDQIREGGLDLLIKLMDIGTPQDVFDIMASVGLGLIKACPLSLLPRQSICCAPSNRRNLVPNSCVCRACTPECLVPQARAQAPIAAGQGVHTAVLRADDHKVWPEGDQYQNPLADPGQDGRRP